VDTIIQRRTTACLAMLLPMLVLTLPAAADAEAAAVTVNDSPATGITSNWAGAQVKVTVLDTEVTNAVLRGFNLASAMTPEGCHVARVEGAADGSWMQVVRDGRPGKRYDEIVAPFFSANGAHLAYAARRKGMSFVVLDDREVLPFAVVHARTMAMSADGSRIGYIAEEFGQPVVVLDGKVQECSLEPWVAAPFLSSDGRRFAFIERDRANHKIRMVIDGQPAPFHDGIDLKSFCFSPDGNRHAYCAFEGDTCCYVVDGRPGELFDGVGVDFVFSPDGKRTAYAGTRGGKRCLVIDGKIDRELDDLVDHTITFSPDNKRLALAVGTSGTNTHILLDGEAGPIFERIGGTWEWGPVARADPRQHPTAIVRGHASGLVFSPDSTRLAYIAGKAGKRFLVVDGQAGPPYDQVGNFAFSADSKHMAYVAVREDRNIIAVDGAERAAYDAVPAGPVFRKDGVIEFIARDANALQRVEVAP
jgi:hypothetical protein